MKRIGLTGGIGSGKSTVAQLFELIGIPVYSADQRARKLMLENAALRQEIRELLGEEAYHEDGNLNRKWIASQVFADKELLAQLNGLVHPAVFRDFEDWAEQHKDQDGVPYVLKEAAILFESGGDLQLDKIIFVSAPEQIRIERVMRRDGVDRASVAARMKNQSNESVLIPRSDFVIFNDGNASLIRQVLEIHRLLH